MIRAHLRHRACPLNTHIRFSMLRFIGLRLATTSATLLTTNRVEVQPIASKFAERCICTTLTTNTLEYKIVVVIAVHLHYSDNKLV